MLYGMAGMRHRRRIHTLTLREQLRKEPHKTIIYILLRLSVVLVLIAQVFNRDWQNVMLCVLTLILFTIPRCGQCRPRQFCNYFLF